MMRRVVPFTALICLCWTGRLFAQNDKQVTEAGGLFKSRCMNCHQPPDLSFATDRAWLDQVNRTA
jgi:hypothetical protein